MGRLWYIVPPIILFLLFCFFLNLHQFLFSNRLFSHCSLFSRLLRALVRLPLSIFSGSSHFLLLDFPLLFYFFQLFCYPFIFYFFLFLVLFLLVLFQLFIFFSFNNLFILFLSPVHIPSSSLFFLVNSFIMFSPASFFPYALSCHLAHIYYILIYLFLTRGCCLLCFLQLVHFPVLGAVT